MTYPCQKRVWQPWNLSYRLTMMAYFSTQPVICRDWGNTMNGSMKVLILPLGKGVRVCAVWHSVSRTLSVRNSKVLSSHSILRIFSLSCEAIKLQALDVDVEPMGSLAPSPQVKLHPLFWQCKGVDRVQACQRFCTHQSSKCGVPCKLVTTVRCVQLKGGRMSGMFDLHDLDRWRNV